MLRRTSLTAATALVAIAGVAVVAATGQEATGKSQSRTYIVQLSDPPIASYRGGTRGLAATSPKVTGRTFLDARSDSARRYRSYLDERQRSALDRAGGDAPKVDYSFRTAFSGFAAELTPAQLRALSSAPEVAKVYKDQIAQPQAISPDDADAALGGVAGGDGASYLGLPKGLWSRLGGAEGAGDGVVVGSIDTGIQPNHPSFAADPSAGFGGPAFGPPPSGFVRSCDAGEDHSFPASACNNKLIGARYFVAGFGKANLGAGSFLSPRDDDGHGSHTAATAAGNYGVNPTIGGNDLGVDVISGIAPRARVATYKVCWIGGSVPNGCADSDSVAAIDQAVADGVNVINYSVGSSSPSVIGATEVAFLGASDAGVFVANSAGNDGPGAETVGSPAAVPWLTTAGASTLARTFSATATVTPSGSPAFTVKGASVTDALPVAPAVDGAQANLAARSSEDGALCRPASLDPAKVTGKVVLCRRGDNARIDKSHNVQLAGGVGMVLYNASDAQELVTDTHFVPSVHVSFTDGKRVKDAIAAGATTIALSKGAKDPSQPGGVMAAFSSRGPQSSLGVPDIAKPDVTAPGVNILAAASDRPAPNSELKPGELFQSISGTSMASPHVAGAGALLHQANPSLDPAALKSELMTTANAAKVKKEDGATPADPFDMGSGEIDPTKAADAGLVVDARTNDYLSYLEGIDPAIVTGDIPKIRASDLNLPSISFSALAGKDTTKRTFTSVDATPRTWTVRVTGLAGIDASASVGAFSIDPGQSKDVGVTLTRTGAALDHYSFGALELTDGTRTVRLPISVQPIAVGAPDKIAVSTDRSAGSQAFSVRTGFSGRFSSLGWGLAAPKVQAAGRSIKSTTGSPELGGSDGTQLYPVDVPAGSQLLAGRLSNVDGGDVNTDLDLYLYADKDGDGKVGAGDLVGQSASGSSDERITVPLPDGGKYVLAVVGFTTKAGGSVYDLTTWVTSDAKPDDDSAIPAITVTGDPVAAEPGKDVPLSLNWSGVDRKGTYLGVATYHDADAGTLGNVRGLSVVELTETADAPSPGMPAPPAPPVAPPATPGGPARPGPVVRPGKPRPKALKVNARRPLLHGRTLSLRFTLSRRARVSVRISRAGRTVTRSRSALVSSGTRTVALRLGRRLRHGTYRIGVTATVARRKATDSLRLRVR